MDLSAPRRDHSHLMDMRKTPSPSQGSSIYSEEGSPSISNISSPGKCSDLGHIGRFNLSGLNLLPRNLLTPTVSAEDRMSPRTLATHIKREIVAESNPLVNLNMEQSIPIPVLMNPVISASANGNRAARPFKAYPHDPLSLAASFTATDGLVSCRKSPGPN